jgi:hypothetical protein
MSQKTYYFDRHAEDDTLRRRLPLEAAQIAARLSVASSDPLRKEDGDPAREAADFIRRELVSPHGRALSHTAAVSFATLYGMATDYASHYPNVTVQPLLGIAPSVALCTYDLYFAIGTAIHYIGLGGIPVTMHAFSGDEPAIILSRELTSLTTAEMKAAFGLDAEMRYEILSDLAKEAGFSVSLRGGDVTELVFRMKSAVVEHIRLLANEDDSLYAAFMLPLSFFHY